MGWRYKGSGNIRTYRGDEILEKAGLTEREETVFLKMKRNESATIVSVAMDLHCSESTINADIKEIKRKIKEI